MHHHATSIQESQSISIKEVAASASADDENAILIPRNRSKRQYTVYSFLQEDNEDENPKHIHLWKHHVALVCLATPSAPEDNVSLSTSQTRSYSSRLQFKGMKEKIVCLGCLGAFGETNIMYVPEAIKTPSNVKQMCKQVYEWKHIRNCKYLPEEVKSKYRSLEHAKQSRRKKTNVKKTIVKKSRCIKNKPNGPGVIFQNPTKKIM